jgi:O-antigen ligase
MAIADQNAALNYVREESRDAGHILGIIITAFLFLFALAQPISIAGAEIAYSAAALVWFVRILLVRRGSLHSSPLDMPLLLYWLLCAASTVLAPLPASSWAGMRKVSLVLLVLLIAHNAPNGRRIKQLIAVLLFSGLVSVAFAAWQYVDGDGLRIRNPQAESALFRAGIRDKDVVLRVDGHSMHHAQQFLTHLNSKPASDPLRLRVIHGGSIDVLKDSVPVTVPAGEWPKTDIPEKLGVQIETSRPARARAFYSHYITYAFVLLFPASLTFGLWLGSGRHFSGWGLAYLGLFAAFSLALGMTLTRSAWLLLALGCAVQTWLHLKRWWLVLLLPIVLLLAFEATNVAMHHWRGVGVIDMADPGTDYRLLMWRDGVRLTEEHPWFGVGMNTIRDAWWQFNLAAYKKYGMREHFHSTPIQIAVELGIPVLISWMMLMGTYCVLLVRLVLRTRKVGDPFLYGLSLGILGGTVGFLAGSLVQYDFGDSVVVLLFWFLAGLALAMWHQLNSKLAGAPA